MQSVLQAAGRALGHYFELFPGGVGKDRSQAESRQQTEGEGPQMGGRWGMARQETDEVWTGRKQRTRWEIRFQRFQWLSCKEQSVCC